MDAGVFPRRPHDAFVTVLDGDGDKSLYLQVGDVGLNLALADVEEFGKIPVGGVTAALADRIAKSDEIAVKIRRN